MDPLQERSELKGLRDRPGLPEDDEAHVWVVQLSKLAPGSAAVETLLSVDERQRADRFVRPEDRMRSVVAHGILRQILGRYLAVEPTDLAFTTNGFGKPALLRNLGERNLSFNMTHSGDVILYAITSGHDIGVDVEVIRTDLDVMELAQGQFSVPEIAALRAITLSEQVEAFFRCWTRKEAYLKARGEGLGFPLKQFSVSFGKNEVPAVQWASDEPAASVRWTMFDLSLVPGYAGAVVIEGRMKRIVTRHWI